MTTHVRLRVRHKDSGHVHCAVFVGKAPELTHAMAGELVLTPEEFATFASKRHEVEVVDESEGWPIPEPSTERPQSG